MRTGWCGKERQKKDKRTASDEGDEFIRRHACNVSASGSLKL